MFKKSTAFALIVFLLMILLPVTDSVSASDEYDSLRLRWEEFLTGGTTFDPSDPDIANRIAEIDNTANDYWSTMNADNVWDDLLGTTISADITEAYGRLYSMALAWATNGSSLESDSSLLHDIIAGLDWMYANRYNENIVPYDNWFNWEIGTPLLLNNITVLLYDGLTSTQITNYMNAVDEFSPDATKSLNGTKTTFGANRVWKCMIVGLRGLIVKDSGKIAHSRDSMSPTFDYKDEGEGFYKDGSYLFHGKNPYNGGYGTGALLNTGNLLYLYAGSSWDFTDPDVENVYQWVFDSFEPFIYKGTVLEEVRGRSISRPIGNHAAGHDVIEAIVQMSELGSAHTSAYKSMIKYWLEEDTYANFYNNRSIFIISKAKSIRNDSSVAPRGELIVHKQFPQMDRVVHRRPGFSFSVSMSSERVKNYESINDENLKGWYYGDGATYLYTGALDEFSDNYWPTVDPYRLPGTTVDTQSRADASGQGSLSSESWVGGASIAGLYGMYGMQLDAWDSSLAAKKSWFMFDDEIVALGTDIESSDGRTIETIVENRKLNATGDNILTVNGTAKSSLLGWTETMNNVQWLHLDGTGGYYFPSATTLEGKREERQGSWYDINHRADTTPYVRNYLTLWKDHGISPSAGSYDYVLLPNRTAMQTGAYAAAPDITILENSPDASVVKENTLNMTGAAFWKDQSKTVDIITSNRKSAIMLKEVPNTELEIAVSDPTHKNTGSIEVEIAKSSGEILSKDNTITVTQLSPTIKFTVNVNGSKGKSHQVKFDLSESADTEAPADITDLSVSSTTGYSADLTWTAPGDDGMVGQADAYEIKMSTAPITAMNWDSAVTLKGVMAPSSAGSSESFEVIGLDPSETYYFAVKTTDTSLQTSGLSNVVSIEAAEVLSILDDFEDGSAAGWTPNAGAWAVESGEYSQNNTSGWGNRATISGLLADDFIIKADVRIISDAGDANRWAGIHFRKTNATDNYTDSGYMLFITNNGLLRLYKAGVGELQSYATGVIPGSFVELKVMSVGSTFLVYFNGSSEPLMKVTDTSYSSGYAGLITGRTHSHFDNVEVKQATELTMNDDFEDGDAAGWTADSGAWAVEAGEYSQSSTNSYGHRATVDGLTMDNAIMKANVRILNDLGNPSNWAGIHFRKTDAADSYTDSGYMAFITNSGILKLYKAGVGLLQSYDTGVIPSGFVELKVATFGSKISVFFNGSSQPVIEVRDTDYLSGYVSLITGKTHSHFDSVEVFE